MSLQIIENASQWKKVLIENKGKSIGFVPTMGALHEGHLSLIKSSQQDNDLTVVSIFLNPTQFNQSDDFQKYPKTFDQDLSLLKMAKSDFCFAPSSGEIYHDNYRYKVTENKESASLCGTARPGHFDGVLTVLIKLFNIIQPHRAYFGEKDYQQLQLVKGMVSALFMDIKIVACPTIRESDGLALSSRNRRLNDNNRTKASQFFQTLSTTSSLKDTRTKLEDLGFKVDYLEEIKGRRFGAVFLDDIRLIDNLSVDEIYEKKSPETNL